MLRPAHEAVKALSWPTRPACWARQYRPATSRPNDTGVFTLGPDDDGDAVVQERLSAGKRMYLHETPARRATDRIVELAKAHRGERSKVLVYVCSPVTALSVARKLSDELGAGGQARVAVLTGTIRGYERDKLVDANTVYHALLNSDLEVEQTVYLVSTSAGEVGIDLDAHDMVCDTTTLDSMVQRLGRVNRRGRRKPQSRIDVVVANEPGKASAIRQATETTVALLSSLPKAGDGWIDVSPRAIRAMMGDLTGELLASAFAPKPPVPPLTDIVLDAWSLTSVMSETPGKPGVAPYLHGLTVDPPESYVAWRAEVQLLYEAHVDAGVLRDWFMACRIESRERLRDSTTRVKDVLGKLLNSQRERNNDPKRDFPVVLLTERGEAQWQSLSEITAKDSRLEYRTIVLPTEVGGLNGNGMLDADECENATDIADEAGERERWLQNQEDDRPTEEELLLVPAQGDTLEKLHEGLVEHHRVAIALSTEIAQTRQARCLVLWERAVRSALRDPETSKASQTLSEHTRRTVEYMNWISDALELPQDLKVALALAAERHDLGKARPVWQRFACNAGVASPLAKSRSYLHGRVLGGYRHELGSLLDASRDEHVLGHVEANLIIHLVAAHHGWARPHFEYGGNAHMKGGHQCFHR